MICFKCRNSINSSVSKYVRVIENSGTDELYCDVVATVDLEVWHIAVHIAADRACNRTTPNFKNQIRHALGVDKEHNLDFLD